MKYNKYTQTYEVCFGDLSKKRQNRILELKLSKAKENYNFLYDCLKEIKANMEHVNKILELLTIFKDKDNTQTIIELEKITDTLYTAINYATQKKDFLQDRDREDLKNSDKETLREDVIHSFFRFLTRKIIFDFVGIVILYETFCKAFKMSFGGKSFIS